MRTTVTLDPDVEAALRRTMADRGISFKQALNDAIRAGAADAPPRLAVRTRARSLGAPRFDLDHALSVAGDLEDAELIRRMRTGQ